MYQLKSISRLSGYFRLKREFRLCLFPYKSSLVYRQSFLFRNYFFALRVEIRLESSPLQFFSLFLLKLFFIYLLFFLFPSHHLTEILCICSGSIWPLHVPVKFFQEKSFFLFLLSFLALFSFLDSFFLLVCDFLKSDMDRLMTCFLYYFEGVFIDFRLLSNLP